MFVLCEVRVKNTGQDKCGSPVVHVQAMGPSVNRPYGLVFDAPLMFDNDSFFDDIPCKSLASSSMQYNRGVLAYEPSQHIARVYNDCGTLVLDICSIEVNNNLIELEKKRRASRPMDDGIVWDDAIGGFKCTGEGLEFPPEINVVWGDRFLTYNLDPDK